MSPTFENLRFNVDLIEATKNLIEFAENIDKKYPELFEEKYVKNAVKRYECFWLPFRVTRTALIVPPLDVHVVWLAHMLNPSQYRAESTAAVGAVIDHHLMSDEDLRASRKISKRIWARCFSREPYDHEFSFKAGPNADLPDYHPLSQCDFLSNVKKLRELGQFANLLTDTDALREAVEKYKQLLWLFSEVPQIERLTVADDALAVWSAHQAHPAAYAKDCQKFFQRFLEKESDYLKSELTSRNTKKLLKEYFAQETVETPINLHSTYLTDSAGLSAADETFEFEYC